MASGCMCTDKPPESSETAKQLIIIIGWKNRTLCSIILLTNICGLAAPQMYIKKSLIVGWRGVGWVLHCGLGWVGGPPPY